MTLYWDLTDSSNYDTDPVFIGRYWGDVLRDDAFVTREALSPAAKWPTATRQVMRRKSRRAG